MAREVIGHMACPECGGAAEVKRTKAGLAYRWCLDCHAQYFPRTAEASDRLVAKCGVTVTAPAPAPEKPKAKAAQKKPFEPRAWPFEPEEKPEAKPVQEPAKPAPPAKPRSPFDDALAFLGGRA